MRKMLSFILVTLLTYIHSIDVKANFFDEDQKSCSKRYDWVKEDSRTQGGGWIWFPGKGVAESLEEAYLRAEGLALERLIQECTFPHKEVKIHERCDERIGKVYQAFVRVSIIDYQCKQTKYAKDKEKKDYLNEKLLAVHQKYQDLISQNSQFPNEQCNSFNKSQCYELGKYNLRIGDYQKALENFNHSCKDNKNDSCFNAGLTALIQKKSDLAKGYFLQACDHQDHESCLMVGQLLNKDSDQIPYQNHLSEKYYLKACELKNSKGCYLLGKLYEEKKDLIESAQLFQKSCEMNEVSACHELSRSYFIKNNYTKALQYASMACKLKHKKGCYNCGVIEELQHHPKNAMAYFLQACERGMVEGCEKVAASLEQKKDQRSLIYYSQACELGSNISCHEASKISFDSHDTNASIKFAKTGCQLGNLKSCHNAGYLEFTSGNTKQAIQILKYVCAEGFDESCQLLKKLIN